MKQSILFTLILCGALWAGLPDKSRYDLPSDLRLSKVSGDIGPNESKMAENEWLSATLIFGGYFTLGTTHGLTDKMLDDRCGLTFGHPYAKTSYPVFSVDGVWYKTEDIINDAVDNLPHASGDTLYMESLLPGRLIFRFSLILNPQEEEGTVQINLSVTNADSVTHRYGLGLFFDPALGQWGDGRVWLDETFLTEEKLITAWPAGLPLTLWERDRSGKGLGMDINFSEELPDTIILGNWPVFYNDIRPAYQQNDIKKLYDLLLKIYWAQESTAPGQTRSESLTVALREPDFSSSAFMRWDLPTVFQIDNGRLFPRSLSSYVQLTNTGQDQIQEAKVEVSASAGFETPVYINGVNLQPDDQKTRKADLRSNLVYEDKVVEVTARFMENDQVLDELSRMVFMPATPVSDTGLVVLLDSLIVEDFPKVSIRFNVQHKAGEYLIRDLSRENIFLYENSERIADFNFGKDTTGGASTTDIVFVLDVTGSMSDEINAVKNNIIEFTDSLAERGVDYRLGMVTFLDTIENVYPFTTDAQEFQDRVAEQRAHGGGDTPENSLDALLETTKFPFRANAKRIAIWITDANYHENDNVTSSTKQQVIDALLLNGITVHSIGNTDYKSSYYDPIIQATGGDFYDIYGNFRDILLDISRLNSAVGYLLSYTSPNTGTNSNTIDLDIRYEGLGGRLTLDYSASSRSEAEEPLLSCYPNPFNPRIILSIRPGKYIEGQIDIYNMLGQRLKKFTFDPSQKTKISWDARNQQGQQVSSGFYIVRLSLKDTTGEIVNRTARILYLK